jgi:type IV secretory pathway VirB3-like protein
MNTLGRWPPDLKSVLYPGSHIFTRRMCVLVAFIVEFLFLVAYLLLLFHDELFISIMLVSMAEVISIYTPFAGKKESISAHKQ